MIQFSRKMIAAIWRRASRLLGRSILEFLGIRCGSSPVFYGLPILDVFPRSTIVFGDRVVFCSSSSFTALGVSRPVIVRTLNNSAKIHIGNDVGLSGTTLCAAQSIVIGNSCLLGADVVICDTDFHPINSANRRYSQIGVQTRPVLLGDNVFVGARTLILKGVSIGSNSIIGAGSIVASDIPANVVAAGNPCKVIKFIDTEL